MTNDEKDLLKKALKGDPSAITEIANKYSRWIYKLALKIVKNVEDANDITQEVILKVITSLQGLRLEEKFSR